MRTAMRLGMWGVGALVLAALVWFGLSRFTAKDDAAAYRTAAIDRGVVSRAISATGQLEPVTTVSVGSTVSGPVQTVEVDFNDRVSAGQVLARLDPTSFEARMTQLRASLAQAEADASVARTDWDRFERLGQQGYASPQLLAQKRAALDRADAQVRAVRAQLDSARFDLERTVIRSPVDGVVINRQVNPGQSVAASFQSPTLFLIAEDLSQLQALISVDEADIGEIREGQLVTFTVDAFPGETFEAEVAQVRQQAASAQGVVTYTVVVRTQNRGGRLLPGMTANADILIERREDVVRLPNAALRFRPGDEALAAEGAALAGGGAGGQARQGGGGQGGEGRGGGQGGGGGGGGQIIEALGLSPEQGERVRAAFQSAAQNVGARPGPEASQEERRAFFRRVREAAFKDIEPILNDEQKAKLAELRAQRPGQASRPAVVYVLRDGAPAAVRVQLGVADDGFTELRGEGLQAGDQVIIGGGPAPKSQPPAPGGGGPNIRIRGA